MLLAGATGRSARERSIRSYVPRDMRSGRWGVGHYSSFQVKTSVHTKGPRTAPAVPPLGHLGIPDRPPERSGNGPSMVREA
jgi:hypothetical protein